MYVSLQSKVCLGACVVISAYAAYSNPARWLTSFAVGVLLGNFWGHSDLQAAREGHFGWGESKDRKVIANAVESLANSMPGLVTTAINLLALGLIWQRVELPSEWDSRMGNYFCNFAALAFGRQIGKLFQLDILRKDQDHQIQNLLDQATI
jgi:hypothetical protein